jgi:hypothetical protein
VKLFNEKLSDLRRQLYTVADTIEQKKVLKGTRWLLLKNQENLDDTRNERHCLEEALRLNQPLATAYYMKEDLGELWAQPSKRHAARFFDDWVARAHASGVRILKQRSEISLNSDGNPADCSPGAYGGLGHAARLVEGQDPVRAYDSGCRGSTLWGLLGSAARMRSPDSASVQPRWRVAPREQDQALREQAVQGEAGDREP